MNRPTARQLASAQGLHRSAPVAESIRFAKPAALDEPAAHSPDRCTPHAHTTLAHRHDARLAVVGYGSLRLQEKARQVWAAVAVAVRMSGATGTSSRTPQEPPATARAAAAAEGADAASDASPLQPLPVSREECAYARCYCEVRSRESL